MKNKILVIGDVMIDKYTFGEVKRLNPEGPNPLLNITNEELKLGGAANVAANIASLNDSCDLIGIIGRDENANLLKKLCTKHKINFKGINIDNFYTIIKQRFIENTYNQQLLRVDYENLDNINKSVMHINSEVIHKITSDYKIIIISDYNKGTIQEEWINKLKKLAKKHNIILLADGKPKNYHLFKGFYLVKPNFKEFCEIIGKNINNEDEEIAKYGLEFVKKIKTNLIITRGSRGASLITKDGTYHHFKTQAQLIFDVSGAGDTFIATLAYALANNYNLLEATKLANKASGIVIKEIGTAIIKKEKIFNS